MRIALLTLGSRGDVQPFVALGSRLLRAGYDVTLVAPAQFADFATEHDLDFAPLDRRFLEMMDQSAVKDFIDDGSGKLRGVRMAMPILAQTVRDSWAGAKNADAIVYHLKILAGYHIAEKLGIPAFMAMPLPIYPTSAFPNPVLGSNVPAALNRLTYAVNSAGKSPMMGMINKWRQEELGLPPRGRFASEATLPDGRPLPVLHAYSPTVVPVPDDWPPHVSATGYWFLDGHDEWEPPAALTAFLNDGPPPVYVGFGSMVTKDPAGKLATIVEALRLAGRRGVVAAGWAGMHAANLPNSIHLLKEAPHEWLFPRMSAVVHHGGAGTTAAGLRAGRPTVVAPFFGDQPFWGRRVHALGVGPEPVPQKRMTPEKLAAAILEAETDTTMRARAVAIGEQIRAEDGTGRAVDFIEQRLSVPVS